MNTTHYTKPLSSEREKSDSFYLRGELARSLSCWHRLSQDESDQLVDLFADHAQSHDHSAQLPNGERSALIGDAICNNAECTWGGKVSDCVYCGSVGPCCPECHETVTACGPTSNPSQQVAVPKSPFKFVNGYVYNSNDNMVVDALKAEQVAAPQAIEPTKGQIKTWIALSTVDGYFDKECLATIAFQNGIREAKLHTQPAQQAAVPPVMSDTGLRDIDRAYVGGWNACREMMLAAAPQPPLDKRVPMTPEQIQAGHDAADIAPTDTTIGTFIEGVRLSERHHHIGVKP